MTVKDIVPSAGERGLIVGRTGSGKTAFATWMLSYMPGTIILDTKIEPKFQSLPSSTVVPTVDDALNALGDFDYSIIRPTVAVASDPKLLDDQLSLLYHSGTDTNIYIDEVYQVHTNGRAGPGLHALLTRGRSRGITTIMSTQRPVWCSRFCLSEANHYYIYDLVDGRDKKTIAECVKGFDPEATMPDFHFSYFKHGMSAPHLFSPIPFDGSAYTDVEALRRLESRWI